MNMRNVGVLLLVSLSICSCRQPEKIPDEEIENKIKLILELPTFEQIYKDIVYFDKNKSFLMFKTMDMSVLFSIDIRLQAGFDLQNGFAIERISDSEIIVYLSEAEILLADADESTIKEYFIRERGGKITRYDYYNEINSQKEVIIQQALDQGILEQASRNGKEIISNFLLAMGFTTVYFKPYEVGKDKQADETF